MEIAPNYKIELARELRRRQTPSEAKLWEALRGHRLNGCGFRRQRPIDRFIADFCCEGARLIIEIDGGYHFTAQQRELDEERAAYLTGRNYSILRFTADEVMTNIETVLEQVKVALTLVPSAGTGEEQGVGATTDSQEAQA